MAFRTNTARGAGVDARFSGSGNRGGPGRRAWGLVGIFAVAMLGCGVSDEGALPPNIEDPATLQTPSGAMARYREAVSEFGSTFDAAMTVGGVLTDELAALPLSRGAVGLFTAIDSRTLEKTDEDASGVLQALYIRLHRLRAQAREGRGFLAAYAPDTSPALQAHLYAIEGYAELFLADVFCSGIPLSTVDFDGGYTLAAGSTTTEVYRHALALFDTALTQAGDSLRFYHLAAVGRGRALLPLRRYAEAAAATAGVSDDYRFETLFSWSTAGGLPRPDSAALFWLTLTSTGARLGVPSMGDQEGGAGLRYRSGGDPRTLPWAMEVRDPAGNLMYFPSKYTADGSPNTMPAGPTNFMVASGVEARLIEAEAALQTGSGEWLTTLNALRTPGTFDLQPNAGNPAVNDTLWHAGSGGVPGLRPLDDPGSDAARVDLLFQERAFWLYLTAHRQGDLRRLIRDYQRAPTVAYPRGAYPGAGGAYGDVVTMPVPETERDLNPIYTGCFHRNP